MPIDSVLETGYCDRGRVCSKTLILASLTCRIIYSSCVLLRGVIITNGSYEKRLNFVSLAAATVCSALRQRLLCTCDTDLQLTGKIRGVAR